MILEEAIDRARGTNVAWDGERASRVLAGALRKREARARRERMFRRGLVVATGASLLVLALFRTALVAPASAEPASYAESAHTAEPIAALAQGDGGFGRD